MSDNQLQPTCFKVIVLRAPIAEPVRTAFGTMQDRPVVLVGIGDATGNMGWGEIWCNFPSCGAEHRAQLFITEIFPVMQGRAYSHPRDCFNELTAALHLLVNQTGEVGPVAQVISGVDIALWDLFAQQQGIPLYQALAPERDSSLPPPVVPVYASGINPSQPEEKVRRLIEAGFTAFKLKVGFNKQLDVRNAENIRSLIGAKAGLMVDANQAWELPQATEMINALSDISPNWVEEPLAVDAPEKDWKSLAHASSLPLAGGENLRGSEAFEKAIQSGIYRFIQPDIAKWGGLSATLPIAQHVLQAGLTYCPHWLGGGVGLLASAHLLGAVGGKGLLEVDSNPNPLRDDLFDWQHLKTSDNALDQTQQWQPEAQPGLGISLNTDTMEHYQVFQWQSP